MLAGRPKWKPFLCPPLTDLDFPLGIQNVDHRIRLIDFHDDVLSLVLNETMIAARIATPKTVAPMRASVLLLPVFPPIALGCGFARMVGSSGSFLRKSNTPSSTVEVAGRRMVTVLVESAEHRSSSAITSVIDW